MKTNSILSLWPLVFGVVAVYSSTVKISRRDVHGMMGVPAFTPANLKIPPDQWFTQFLDHFELTETKTWQQRYFVVEDNYKVGGPVFLQIGGEGEASPKWMVNGAWVDYAKKYNAIMFQLEHRYYGKSQPTSDLSVENLRYLTSEQALADLAYFITAMNVQYNLPLGSKWIAFGGSYPGNLAAWVRSKYPHLVHAAMSASGPVLAKIDFMEYMEVVKDSLGTYSAECVNAVSTADKYFNILLRHPIGQTAINKKFRLCDPIDPDKSKDVASLLETLAGNFAGVVQYNKDNRVFSESSDWNVTIDDLCGIMVDESLGTPVDRYAAVNALFLDLHKEMCLDYKYDKMVEEMQNTTWGATNGGRQWTYQTCTEFGYFQTAESNLKLFGNDFPVDFFIQQCTDIFGKEFNEDMIVKGAERTNILYGGLDVKATRVVYVHGSIDPWHALGITRSIIPESPSIFINGTAHCANMYPPADTDLPALRAAREEISTLIGKWLEESQYPLF